MFTVQTWRCWCSRWSLGKKANTPRASLFRVSRMARFLLGSWGKQAGFSTSLFTLRLLLDVNVEATQPTGTWFRVFLAHNWTGSSHEDQVCLSVFLYFYELSDVSYLWRSVWKWKTCRAESLISESFFFFLPLFREASPLWPSRGRLRCTSNSSSTWGKPTARSSTSPSRRKPEGGGAVRREDGRTNHTPLPEGWGGGGYGQRAQVKQT